MHATKAAAEEGIVPGGGVAYLRAGMSLEGLTFDDDDEQVGVTIVRRALEEPLRQIAANAGFEGAVVVGKIKEDKNVAFGFNAETEKFEDLVEAGVIDPTMVARTAMQNAASIASLLLTTEALVTELPETDKDKTPMPHGGGDMGGMY